MTLSRRRFLAISAAMLGAGPARSAATPARWRGVALGAEAEITIHGPGAERALAEALALVRAVEAEFSLYDPGSALSRLNRAGRLAPSPTFAELLGLVDRVPAATGGAFDPTVQPLWEALARGGSLGPARAAVGWERVRLGGGEVRLGAGQALTFNGIAQGFATDAVADMLEARGFGRALVDIGEHRALGGPWRVGLADPVAGYLGTRTLDMGAIATSSPDALRLGLEGHILDPRGGRGTRWSTVSVEATRAAIADAVSTGCCLLDLAQIGAVMRRLPEISAVTLVDADGNLRSLRA